LLFECFFFACAAGTTNAVVKMAAIKIVAIFMV